MSALIDIAGKTFGSLKVTRLVGTKRYRSGQTHAIWECVCLECGSSAIVPGGSLRHKHNPTKKCKTCSKEGKRLKMQKPHQHEKYMLNYYKRHAKTRNLEFSLSLNDVISLVLANCVYCGKEPELGSGCPQRHARNAIKANGIDRIDSSIGYIISNCAPCCFLCNRAKSNMDVREFLDWVKCISNYQYAKSPCPS